MKLDGGTTTTTTTVAPSISTAEAPSGKNGQENDCNNNKVATSPITVSPTTRVPEPPTIDLFVDEKKEEIPDLTPEVLSTTTSTTTTASTRTDKDGEVCDNDSSSSSNNKKKNMKRSVSFDSVKIREYSRCLGNNPAVTHGPPLSLDWDYIEAGVYDLDEYEMSRPPRRMTHQMLVPGMVREEIILSQTDSTRNQINRVLGEIKTARHQRQATVALQEFENLTYAVETIRRRFRRFKTGISKQREEEMLWENAKQATKDRRT